MGKMLLNLPGRTISSCHGLLVRYTPQQVPWVCARTFISYSAPTSAKFPERISKRLLCKVRNTHRDELFGRSRAHDHVKRVHRRHMRRTGTRIARRKTHVQSHTSGRQVYVHTHTCTGCNGVVFIAPENCIEIMCETLLY